MSLFAVFAIVITLTAIFAFVNERFLKLPTTIGAMVSALVASMILIGLGHAGIAEVGWAKTLLETVDFDDLLMTGMLSFLLFAGALHVNLESLLERKWSILALATIGVTLSTFLVGTAAWGLFRLLGFDIPYIYGLLFGALISPTDPIAVLGLLKRAGADERLETIITGESLFNDGVGVVVFLLIRDIATGAHETTAPAVAKLFAIEAVGGVVLGLIAGYVAYLMIRQVDQYIVEILITLAVVSGGYAIAGYLHTSGPLAMVVAGLLVGNHGRTLAMSEHTRENLDNFWELIDEILNAVLFVLIGLEVLVLELRPAYLLAGLAVIPVVLLSRVVSTSVPLAMLRWFRQFPPYIVTILVWGGLRGGISIALALSLPVSPYRDLILVATYTVVVFSILVQGLSVARLTRWAAGRT
ncbi:MAG: sodium:proton antiporter [Acidobacteriota bacterium]|nr:sodium:proton antiporter [Acidobacteriota bacterium]